jgi:hypothetical protein
MISRIDTATHIRRPPFHHALHVPSPTYLFYNPFFHDQGVDTTIEEDLLRPFPIFLGSCRLALLKIHSDMALVPTPTQDVVFAVLGTAAVLLFNTRPLTTTHFCWKDIHHDVHRCHDMFCRFLMMSCVEGTLIQIQ